MKFRAEFCIFCFILLINGFCGAETLRFSYREGQKYKIVSVVNEDVYVDGKFTHHADIMNKIAIEVAEVRGGAGRMKSQFLLTERSLGGAYTMSEEYSSDFFRDGRGIYSEESDDFMPVVRNVPVFPERDLKVGESWVSEGYEIHDFRRSFGIPEAFKFPITVSYTYQGKKAYKGLSYDAVSIKYNVFHRPKPQYSAMGIYPVRISGYSDQLLYWDNKTGMPFAYKEEFDLILDLSNGQRVEYRGTAEAEVTESSLMDREEIAEEVRKTIADKGMEDTGVVVSDKGVTISLENIKFLPNSSILTQGEKDKIRAIAAILGKYPEKDLLITGHTAYASGYTEEEHTELSVERAQSVANYLLELGVRKSTQMITQGKGHSEPSGDNRTEEGMKKNRRVEITILEN